MKKIVLFVFLFNSLSSVYAQQPSSQSFNWYKVGAGFCGVVAGISTWKILSSDNKKQEPRTKESKKLKSDWLTAILWQKRYIDKMLNSKELTFIPESGTQEFVQWTKVIAKWKKYFPTNGHDAWENHEENPNRHDVWWHAGKNNCTLVHEKLNGYFDCHKQNHKETPGQARTELRYTLQNISNMLENKYLKVRSEFFPKNKSQVSSFIIPGMSAAATVLFALKAYN